MYIPGLYFDPTMIMILPAVILAGWAQIKVSSTLGKYSQVRISNGMTGADIARRILDLNGLYNVPVQLSKGGSFSDYYDPRTRSVHLSNDVYYNASVAAAGVAAHEVGHAIQHATNYKALMLRTSIAKTIGFASQLSMILFILGLIFTIQPLQTIGIIFFTATVFYQLITLPVEFNASQRALRVLESTGMLYSEEVDGAKKCLTAAAMTYVAAAFMAISQLLRLIVLSKRDD